MTDLTDVKLVWIKGRIENWIRFGHCAEQRILDLQQRILSYAPGSIFAFVRWPSNDYGTILSKVDVLRAVAPGEACSTLPYVRPGGEMLLRQSGWRKVETVLQAIDAIETLGMIRRTLPPIIGGTSTIASRPGKRQDPTHLPGIGLGCSGES